MPGPGGSDLEEEVEDVVDGIVPGRSAEGERGGGGRPSHGSFRLPKSLGSGSSVPGSVPTNPVII